MKRLAAALAVALVFSLVFAARPDHSLAASDAPAAATKPTYQLKGFRSARFGMTRAQVKAAIQKDFRIRPETIQEAVIAEGRTPMLLIHVAALFSQSGVGDVAYLFGYHSEKLVQVSITLSTETDPDLNADRLLVDGKLLQNYLLGLGYPSGKVVVNRAVANGLVMFQGIDPLGRLTSLQLLGKMTKGGNGQTLFTPQLLRLNYVADPEHPDMMKSLAGQF